MLQTVCVVAAFLHLMQAFSHDLVRYLKTNYEKSRRVVFYSNFAVALTEVAYITVIKTQF